MKGTFNLICSFSRYNGTYCPTLNADFVALGRLDRSGLSILSCHVIVSVSARAASEPLRVRASDRVGSDVFTAGKF